MTEAPRLPEDDDAIAAELALGVLAGDERAAAQRRVLAEPAFAVAVMDWSDRLAPMATLFAEATPPDTWPAIERRLPAAESVATGSVARLRWWQGGTIAAGALAASLAAVLVFRPLPPPVTVVQSPPPTQLAVGQLAGADDRALLAVSYDSTGGLLRIRPIRLPASDLAAELWLIPVDGVPRSLGLIASTGVSRVAIEPRNRRLFGDGVTLAVSLEVAGGAPHVKPSSAPIAAGTISTI